MISNFQNIDGSTAKFGTVITYDPLYRFGRSEESNIAKFFFEDFYLMPWIKFSPNK